MENRLYKIKDKLITKIEQETEDMDRMNANEVGTLVDAVHHIAEAEYYCQVSDAMWAEKHGYMGGGTGSSAPVTQARSMYTEQPMRSGYMPAEPMGYGTQRTMGYHDPMESLRTEFQKASPDERERLRMEAMKLVGAM